MKFSDLPDCAQKEACALLASKYCTTPEEVNKIAQNIARAFCTLFEYENDVANDKCAYGKQKHEFKNVPVYDPAKGDYSTVFIASYDMSGSFAGYILYNKNDLSRDKNNCENTFKYSLDQHVIAKSGIGYGRVVSRNKSVCGEIYAVNIESGAMKGKTLYFEESTLYGVP